MIVSIIVAVAKNMAIGKDNKLLWKLSDDLKRFKELTMNHHVLFGRKTYESIGKALPGRKNIVLSRNFSAKDVDVVSSLDEGLNLARSRNETEFFLCGGAEVYARGIELADKMYITNVDVELDGDAFFPNVDFSCWHEINRELVIKNDKNEYNFEMITYVRKEKK